MIIHCTHLLILLTIQLCILLFDKGDPSHYLVFLDVLLMKSVKEAQMNVTTSRLVVFVWWQMVRSNSRIIEARKRNSQITVESLIDIFLNWLQNDTIVGMEHTRLPSVAMCWKRACHGFYCHIWLLFHWHQQVWIIPGTFCTKHKLQGINQTKRTCASSPVAR